MAKIAIDGQELVVESEGLFEQMMSMRSSLRVPLEHVTGIRSHPSELEDNAFILRVFGASLKDTHIGYFWKKEDGLVFCNIHDMKEVVAIDLRDERMKHLYIQVSGEPADSVAERLRPALAQS